MKRAALVVAVFACSAPAAHATGLEALQRLAKAHLRPAPLVPIKATGVLSNLDVTLDTGAAAHRRGAYAVRLAHYTLSGPDAIIALSRGDYGSMRAALRDFRRGGYKLRATRIRGRRGVLATRKLTVREADILWTEDGAVYSIGTGTMRKVSVKDLRFTAASLDRLGANYIGSYFAPGTNNTSFDAVLVTTAHTLTGELEFGTDNCTFNGAPGAAHGGSATFTALPLRSNAFTIPLASDFVSPQGWSGTIDGTVSPSAVTLTMQGTGTFDDEPCDTGRLSVTAEPQDPI